MRSIAALISKDVSRFFSHIIQVSTLLIFYLVMGMLMWILPGSGILDGYYAQVDLFFTTAPILLVFLIPALNMVAISEERSQQTLDLLLTRPVSSWEIVLGKYLSGILVILIGLLPTLMYVVTVYYLGDPVGNIDMGAVIGSYLGLFLLMCVFTAISLFASSLVPVPMTALIVAVFLCIFSYWAFFLISKMPLWYGVWDYWVQYLGLEFHYKEMGRGLISLHSVVYMVSLAGLFLYGSFWQIESMRRA